MRVETGHDNAIRPPAFNTSDAAVVAIAGKRRPPAALSSRHRARRFPILARLFNSHGYESIERLMVSTSELHFTAATFTDADFL